VSQIDVGNTAAVAFAGIVKSTFREPVENWTAGSSLGITLFDVKVTMSEPKVGVGCGADRDRLIGSCWAGLIVAGTFTKDREPISAGAMEIVKAAEVVKLELSVACTVNVKTPTRLGVPLISPDDPRFKPSGKVPFVCVHV
jgi:hypothetical protein